jgi:hypothetical protein
MFIDLVTIKLMSWFFGRRGVTQYMGRQTSVSSLFETRYGKEGRLSRGLSRTGGIRASVGGQWGCVQNLQVKCNPLSAFLLDG